MRKNYPVISREYLLDDDELLISRTDLKGIITYANPAFIRVSGFSYEELLGQPHNLVRHPEMPPAAFANLWETLQRGQSWNGLVKNRRKNGEYYWVRANVTPHYKQEQVVGFTSVRTKPNPEEVRQAEMFYQQLNEGRPVSLALVRGRLMPKGVFGALQIMNPRYLRTKIAAACFGSVGILGVSQLLWLRETTGLESLPDGLLYGQAGLLLLAGCGAAFLATSINRPMGQQLGKAADYLAQVIAGNLDSHPPALPGNELDELFHLLDSIRKSLRSISDDVKASLSELSQASRELAAGNSDLATRTESQARSVQQAAASMAQITSAVRQNVDSAMQVSTLSDQSAAAASASHALMLEAVEKMQGILTASRKMSEIIELIESISTKTNLLAINASIESAHAGKYGLGFAVVAKEVRSLANLSSSAAKQVKELIEGSSLEIRQGAELVGKGNGMIEGMVSASQRLSDIMGEIARASREQGDGVAGINEGLGKIDGVTQENARLVQRARALSDDLERHLVDAQRTIALFTKRR